MVWNKPSLFHVDCQIQHKSNLSSNQVLEFPSSILLSFGIKINLKEPVQVDTRLVGWLTGSYACFKSTCTSSCDIYRVDTFHWLVSLIYEKSRPNRQQHEYNFWCICSDVTGLHTRGWHMLCSAIGAYSLHTVCSWWSVAGWQAAVLWVHRLTLTIFTVIMFVGCCPV